MDHIIDGLLWLSAVSVALMAGVYFSFSAFVMRSLDVIGMPSAMIAMQSINRVIVRSAFLPLFFGSTALCCILFTIMAFDTARTGAVSVLTGSEVYVAGMFVITVVKNVPLNNALEATPADSANADAMWRRYMREWVRWNHVRTISCIVAMVCLVLALCQRG